MNEHYDGIEIALHWATVLLVTTLYGLAQAWSFIQRGSPSRVQLQSVHVSLGMCLAVVLVLRIIWRVGPGRRLPPAASGIAEVASKLVHYALYVLLACVIILGVSFRWTQHVPLSLFGWFAVPAPYPFSQKQEQLVGDLHYWVATVAVILACGHAAAPSSISLCCTIECCDGCCQRAVFGKAEFTTVLWIEAKMANRPVRPWDA
jgi:cytochrome b561